MGLFDIKKYDKGDKKYNVALGIPQYLPTGVKIDIEACADTKKYKELLDSGIITQEEFEIKKKELLG